MQFSKMPSFESSSCSFAPGAAHPPCWYMWIIFRTTCARLPRRLWVPQQWWMRFRKRGPRQTTWWFSFWFPSESVCHTWCCMPGNPRSSIDISTSYAGKMYVQSACQAYMQDISYVSIKQLPNPTKNNSVKKKSRNTPYQLPPNKLPRLPTRIYVCLYIVCICNARRFFLSFQYIASFVNQ